MIPLFEISFKPGIRTAPVRLICQTLFVEGEMLLWVDGIDSRDPIVIPLSAAPTARPLADYETFLRENLDLSRLVLEAGAGELSPTITARAVTAMSADPALDAEAALEMVQRQAQDLIVADRADQGYFWAGTGAMNTSQVRPAAP